MDPLLVAVTALAVSIAVIPVMIRLAPRLRMLDRPSARKLHRHPVPRVGGWGMCTGALIASIIWLQVDVVAASFLIGGIILLIGGALDDMNDLPAMAKLLVQFIATLPTVAYAGLVLDTLPFFGIIQIPMVLAVPLTWISLVGCINATNTSDGLDGLAAGATLLSLSGILYLCYVMGASNLMILAAASLGGLLGFFRYNTHPAIIFMGDLGSQFLGFAVGFLAFALLQVGEGHLSPWSLLLLTGLPVADIVVVAIRRMMRGVSPFKADRTHIHHRYLNVGLSHNQAVVLIYGLQASFVTFGVVLHDAAAWKILVAYMLHLGLIYGSLSVAEQRATPRQSSRAEAMQDLPEVDPNPLLLWLPRVGLETLLPSVLILSPLLAETISPDFGVLGAALVVPLLIGLMKKDLRSPSLVRVPVFLVATALLYLYTNARPFESMLSRQVEIAVIALLGAMAFIAVRFSPKRRKEEFRATSMDYLLIVFVILAVVALRTIPTFFNPYFLLYLPVILYCCELLMIERRQRRSWLPPAAAVASAIMAVRGLLL